jgi:GNAT superfamily N-acetyltransferase
MMERQSVIAAERAERAALVDLHSAAPEPVRRRLGLELQTVDGALASIAAADPTILVNRVVGLGVESPTSASAVADIISLYRDFGVTRYFLHLDPNAAPSELSRWLTDAGLAPYRRAWAKFVRTTTPPPNPTSDLEVRRVGTECAEWFGRIAAQGFGLGDRWVPVLAGLVGRPGWHVFLSFDGDTPAGCGALRVHQGVAWFDWAATRAEYRRRGSQGAILAHRVAHALALGCSMMVTATGEAVPGEPQHSYRNILRAAFRLSHSRANWVPSAA